jgi:hypothetical protein
MKNLTEETLVFLALLLIIFCAILFGFGTGVYSKYLDAYNTQKDRELFTKTHEIVVECRKSYGLNSNTADRVCGEVPVFFDKVS